MPTPSPSPKSDLHATGAKPINLANKSRRLEKIASANIYSEQSHPPKMAKTSLAPKSIVSKQPGLVREQNRQVLGNFHRGGKVHRTGVYKLEKGERVKRVGAAKSSHKRA